MKTSEFKKVTESCNDEGLVYVTIFDYSANTRTSFHVDSVEKVGSDLIININN